MKALLPSYSVLKDSGARWLGSIPESWSVMRSKRLFVPRIELARPDDIQLSATQAYGVIPQAEFEQAVARKVTRILQHLEKRRHVEVDDFVISMRSFQGGLERAWASGCIRSSYVVLRPATPLVVGYYAHLFKSHGYIRALQSTASFIRDGQDLNFANFCEVALPCPPLDEQRAIARFLDYADRRIRRYISAKVKLMKLLEEQKQAIVYRAVTCSLDPSVRLKPSGVEWLGDVPEHWEMVRLGRVIDLVTGFPFKSEGFTQQTGDVRLLRGINVSPGRIRWTDVVRWPQSERDNFRAFELEVGDIVLGMDRPLIQTGTRVGIVTESDVPALLLQRVARIRPTDELSSEFLALLLAGKSFADYLTPIFTGISVPHLSPEQIKAFRFAQPPNNEQREIVRWVAEKTKETTAAVLTAEHEIDLLREYRTRLIADVVTGKIDVREAAARLPEDVEEPDEGDETEADGDAEEPSDELDALAAEAEA